MEIGIEKNILKLNGKEIKFNNDIRQFKTVGDDVVVLLAIPNNDNTLDNIYCYSSNGIIKWQVQPIKEAFPEMKQVFPFEQMSILDDKIGASDFYGRRFMINISDGKIVQKDIVKLFINVLQYRQGFRAWRFLCRIFRCACSAQLRHLSSPKTC